MTLDANRPPDDASVSGAKHPDKPSSPPPVAPSLGESLEAALQALIRPGSVYGALAARPAPGAGTSLAAGVALAAAGAALAVALAAVGDPGALAGQPPERIALAGAAAILLSSIALTLAAALMLALGRTLGQGGDFARALQAVSLLAVLSPLHAVLGAVPYGWLGAHAAAAWLGGNALASFFKAGLGPALGVCAALAFIGAGGEAVARVFAAKARAVYDAQKAVAQMASGTSDVARQLQAMQDQMRLAAEAQSAMPAAAGRTSSLDLLRGPDGEAPPPSEVRPQLQAIAAQGQAIQQNAMGMMDSLMPMLNNPAVLNAMPPAQRESMKELNAMMAQMRSDMATGRKIPPQERAERMARIQKMMTGLMSSSAGVQRPAPPAAPAGPPAP